MEWWRRSIWARGNGITIILLSLIITLSSKKMKTKNKYKKHLSNILSVAVLIGCMITAVNGMAAFGNKKNGIDYTDPQKPLMVKRSQPTFVVTLQSNPTTGFSWALKTYDQNFIRPVSKVFYPAKNGLIGAGGYEKWTFMVRPNAFVVPQTTSITLIYSRPWEMEGAQALTFKVVTTNDS